MSEIKTFSFSQSGTEEIRKYKYGADWPVVYIIENGKELYVGETIRAYGRTKEHLENEKRKVLKNVHVISDDEFNKSATLDTESSLIEYLVADGQFKLQNGNGGLQNHSYFDREKYTGKFEVLWKKLQEMRLAKNDLLQIRNSDLFKYSPYKTLTSDQYIVANKILKDIKEKDSEIYVIHGGPGTGKTILATYLVKRLVEEGNQGIGLVIAMTSLRKTLKKVFRGIPGLKPAMVIAPGDVAKKKYDVLIVDEAHRLRRRKNITNYASFDKTNRELGLNKESDELDWILQSAKHNILFYDERQSVRPSDISSNKMHALSSVTFELKTQMRVEGGQEYIQYIDDVLEARPADSSFQKYDFKIYDNIREMIADIKQREKEYTLSRMIAGYAWEWRSRNDSSVPDIIIGDTELFWNSQIQDWVNSKNAINEVGCIHTIQGYDLNYAGVIIGPELSYDLEKKELIINRKKYLDANGHRGVTNSEELKRYIINIYKTLLTRGIKGTYVYAVDENLRNYLKSSLSGPDIKESDVAQKEGLVLSPFSDELVRVPLLGTAPCGTPFFGQENQEGEVMVGKNKIKPGFQYFALRAEGDSMDAAGINNGDLVLCRQQEKAETGDRVIALLDGENVTIKEYGPRIDGTRLLLPKSTNPKHLPITPGEGDVVQGIVQEVLPRGVEI